MSITHSKVYASGLTLVVYDILAVDASICDKLVTGCTALNKVNSVPPTSTSIFSGFNHEYGSYNASLSDKSGVAGGTAGAGEGEGAGVGEADQ